MRVRIVELLNVAVLPLVYHSFGFRVYGTNEVDGEESTVLIGKRRFGTPSSSSEELYFVFAIESRMAQNSGFDCQRRSTSSGRHPLQQGGDHVALVCTALCR